MWLARLKRFRSRRLVFFFPHHSGNERATLSRAGTRGSNHMHSLRNLLQEEQENGAAIGHFNISDLVLLKAVFAAAQELNVRVWVGLSEADGECVGVCKVHAC